MLRNSFECLSKTPPDVCACGWNLQFTFNNSQMKVYKANTEHMACMRRPTHFWKRKIDSGQQFLLFFASSPSKIRYLACVTVWLCRATFVKVINRFSLLQMKSWAHMAIKPQLLHWVQSSFMPLQSHSVWWIERILLSCRLWLIAQEKPSQWDLHQDDSV